MPLVKIEQELTDGWRILGTLTLEGHKGYAYQHLWNAISRTGLALLAGLLVFSLVITWVCRRLLRPLEQISLQLARIRKRQFSGNLPTPWLRELQEVVVSINQLVSERKRDPLQQRSRSPSLASTTLSRPTRSSLGWSTPMATPISSISSPLRGVSGSTAACYPSTPTTDSSPDEIRGCSTTG
jgi:hypothetical protein